MRSFLRLHAPAILATLFLGAALLVTGEMVVAVLTGVGAAALLPFAERLLGPPSQPGGDKLVHVLLFFVYTAILARSFSLGRLERTGGSAPRQAPAPLAERASFVAASLDRTAVWLAGLFSFLFSGSLELAQGAVGRYGDLRDLLANGVGVGLCVAWLLFRRRRR
ncbi:MAG TPA: hypothetical protein VMT85_24345 [Thermoanaerobaculia bacterium]|nr:hypothetical protein [Thermoanaerobaculia bacterium]